MNSKIEHSSQTVNSSERLLCCFDVSKTSRALYAQYPKATDTRSIEEKIPNQTGAIEEVLVHLVELAEEAHLEGLLILAEATGGYERKLLETARRLGHDTGRISPDYVAKLKTVDSDSCREPAKPTTKTRG